MSKTIPIFLAADEKYAKFCAITMFSVLKNTKSNIDFYILDGGITQKTQRRISEFISKFKNATLEFLSLENCNMDSFPNKGHYTTNTYSRYFIPRLKPNLGKILYIDCDLIVTKDIKMFFDEDLEGYPIAATSEDFYKTNAYNLKKFYPQFSTGIQYFNAGVLIMDIQKFIKEDYATKLIETVAKYYNDVCCPSQDIMNIVFENNYKIVDYKYNLMPDLFHMLKEYRPQITDEYKKEAVMVHYVSGKPWFNNSCMSDIFWQYTKQTPFYFELKINLLKYNIEQILKTLRKMKLLYQITIT